jgi:hypothetical protein
MKEHLCIHRRDGTCEICGVVNARIRYSWDMLMVNNPSTEKSL